MPAFLTHFYIADLAFREAGALYNCLLEPPLFPPKDTLTRRAVSQWAYFGSMGPDVCGGNDEIEWVFDSIHFKQSNRIVADWLDRLSDSPADSAQLAYVLGFLAHMAGDIIVHPYVNLFAGVYDDQTIKEAIVRSGILPTVPIISGIGYIPPFRDAAKAALHKFVELHEDTYVAQTCYGVRSLSEADEKGVPSWAAFIGEATQADAYKAQYNQVIDAYLKVVGNLYQKPPDRDELTRKRLEKALSRIRDIGLEWGYDAALGPVRDKHDPIFVEHKMSDRPFVAYLNSAAKLAVRFWEAAFTYLQSPRKLEDRKAFFSIVRNFNLDTGFAPRVSCEGSTIYIRHDHSWALYLRTSNQMYDAETPPEPRRHRG